MKTLHINIDRLSNDISRYRYLLRFIFAAFIGSAILYIFIVVKGLINPLYFAWTAFPERYGDPNAQDIIIPAIINHLISFLGIILFYKVLTSTKTIWANILRWLLIINIFITILLILISIASLAPFSLYLFSIILFESIIVIILSLLGVKYLNIFRGYKSSLVRDSFLREHEGINNIIFRNIVVSRAPWLSWKKRFLIYFLQFLSIGLDAWLAHILIRLTSGGYKRYYLYRGIIYRKNEYFGNTDEAINSAFSAWLDMFSQNTVLLFTLFIISNAIIYLIIWLSRAPYKDVEKHQKTIGTLILRPFSNDKVIFSRTDKKPFYKFISNNLDDLISRRYSYKGPIVAIGNPEDKNLPIGAHRDYTSDKEWKEKVANYTSIANLIVLVTGNTDGVEWEMDHIVNNSLLEKTIIMAMPSNQIEEHFLKKIDVSIDEKSKDRERNIIAIISPDKFTRLVIWSNFSDMKNYDTALRISHRLLSQNEKNKTANKKNMLIKDITIQPL